MHICAQAHVCVDMIDIMRSANFPYAFNYISNSDHMRMHDHDIDIDHDHDHDNVIYIVFNTCTCTAASISIDIRYRSTPFHYALEAAAAE